MECLYLKKETSLSDIQKFAGSYFGHTLEGNLGYPSELRRVVKVGVMADGAPVNLHITEVQISGG